MEINAESSNIKDYTIKTEIIDYDNKLIVDKCYELEKDSTNDIDLINKVYEFVRDEIAHSGDIGKQKVTCKASEVLMFGHGICCAKSHLLAAMLRFFRIPTGFCYQKLCLNDGTNKKVLHGLNAVYLGDLGKWMRIDARGNKEGVDAQFCLEEEKIAWKTNRMLGEEDNPIIYKEPNKKVIELLMKNEERKELFNEWEMALKDVFNW